jgi:carotenoid 1,2-hydratase
MTERGAGQVERSAHHFKIGPSQLTWRGGQLVIELNELSLPTIQGVKGQIVLTPLGLSNQLWPLSGSHEHWWGPLATNNKIELKLEQPSLNWRGTAYWDYNEGSRPINDPACEYASWDWTRATFANGSSQVVYDVRAANGQALAPLILDFDISGKAVPVNQAVRFQPLPKTGWRIKRRCPVNTSEAATVMHTLEDTPFYCRDVVSTVLNNQAVVAMHESLDVARLSSTLVQGMLPFKMPRRANT